MGELIDKTKGKAKQELGKITGNRDLEAEGALDQAKGKAKEAFEELKHSVRKPPDRP